MKYLLKPVVLFIFLSCSFVGKAQDLNTQVQKNQATIEVFDFHTTNRCVTCRAIESNTQYTLDTYFSEELKNGQITFKIVNIDKKENRELAQKFLAAGTSLYLNVIKNGKEKQIELTQFAFMYGKNRSAFSKRLKEKIEKQLKNS